MTSARPGTAGDRSGVVGVSGLATASPLSGARVEAAAAGSHSTPWEPRGEYVHPHSAKLDRFAEADADIVLYGHTHCRVVKRIGSVLVINPGSAGDGQDSRNNRQLSCPVLDTMSEEVSVLDYPDHAVWGMTREPPLSNGIDENMTGR